jgi:hypothetical protein
VRTEWQERIGVGEAQPRSMTKPELRPVYREDNGKLAGYQKFHPQSERVDAIVQPETVKIGGTTRQATVKV